MLIYTEKCKLLEGHIIIIIIIIIIMILPCLKSSGLLQLMLAFLGCPQL